MSALLGVSVKPGSQRGNLASSPEHLDLIRNLCHSCNAAAGPLSAVLKG